MKQLCVVLLIVSLIPFTPLNTYSQTQQNQSSAKPVIVTASRIETPLDQIGKSVSIITQKDIQNNVNSFFGNLVEPTPSLRIRQNGGPGTFSPIQIRGSNPNQVLLMINGLPIQDASNFGGDASDLIQNLSMDDVERIEIVRGPLSTLYGADALGGTINIITKKGTEGFSTRTFFEGGTENTFRESINARGGNKDLNYSFTTIRNDSDGLDSHDVFNATTLSGRVEAKINEKITLDSFIRFNRSRVNFDELGNPPGFVQVDDPTRLQRADAFFWGFQLIHKITQDWEQILRYAYNNVHTKIDDDIDPSDTLLPGLLLNTDNEGVTHNIELQENYYGIENHILTFGLEYERQEADVSTVVLSLPEFRFREEVDNKAVFLQDQFQFWEDFFLTSGLRIDDFASFGTTVNFAFSLAYLIKELGTKLKANVGTAFNDPSLTQLYDPLIGNSNLDPEEVIGFDFGFEQPLFEDRVWIGATFFRQDYEELITISRVVTPAGITRRAINSGKALAQGLELESRFKVCENFNLGVNYTYTDSELETPDTRIPEIPDSLVSVFANLTLIEKVKVHLNVDFVDDSIIVPRPGFPKNEAQTTVDLAVSYDVDENMSLFGRVENLFDEKYKDDTLEAPGFFAFGGFVLKL